MEVGTFVDDEFRAQPTKRVAETVGRLLVHMWIRGEITEAQLYLLVTGRDASADKVVFSELPSR